MNVFNTILHYQTNIKEITKLVCVIMEFNKNKRIQHKLRDSFQIHELHNENLNEQLNVIFEIHFFFIFRHSRKHAMLEYFFRNH